MELIILTLAKMALTFSPILIGLACWAYFERRQDK